MERLHETYRLLSDGDGLLRLAIRQRWDLPTVTAGDVYLSREGERIDASDPDIAADHGGGLLEELLDRLDTSDAPSLFVAGFRFQSDDNASSLWYPQGLSGSPDADASGRVDGRKFLVVGWYRRGRKDDDFRLPCSRISLIDVTSLDEVRYRHILLVEPVVDDDGRESFQAVISHCGGIVWFQRWLYVTDEDQLLVFDMEAITDIKAQNPDYADDDIVGYDDGRYRAGGFRYILPLVAAYAISDSPRSTFFSTLGLDRSTDPPRLVGAKYISEGAKYDHDVDDSIVVFFDLDEGTGLLATTGGHVDASDAALAKEKYVQGVHARGDTVWLCQSSQVNRLLRREIGSGSGDEYEWARGGEGLMYSESTDRLWNVTEFQNDRVCFAVLRSDVE